MKGIILPCDLTNKCGCGKSLCLANITSKGKRITGSKILLQCNSRPDLLNPFDCSLICKEQTENK